MKSAQKLKLLNKKTKILININIIGWPYKIIMAHQAFKMASYYVLILASLSAVADIESILNDDARTTPHMLGEFAMRKSTNFNTIYLR